MVTWINCFEVPDGQQDRFFAVWREMAVGHFKTKPGFVNYRMYRARNPEGRFQFVNVTQWESAEHIAAAHDERFRELLRNPEIADVVASPGMFDLVDEG
ncbi:antibiotic biosynthesis monooxygenase family protein [Kibdelosporangium aridum]|uniref:Antibiotic biosynthesis monooxygenase n=1 Tax=Kibdelosporangium aridum TaxID=2030 RepID=A0A1W2F0E7_KIBAR|nr:antibiotic biosynthesis monooxygenase [Kibdelosporangium aridum]SMD15443.1 Antibiotic biosynthesis monooxygenase [Kibdelosporangium aridum]